jgi:hypothetical protein
MAAESRSAGSTMSVIGKTPLFITVDATGANKLARPVNIVHTVFTFFGLELYPED